METVAVKPQGKIQIRVWRFFFTRPDAVATTGELCRWVFPRALGVIPLWFRKSIRRNRKWLRELPQTIPRGA
jgi:hypothetical protein